jgi:DNA-binding transcriptional ArsR family regulator
MTKNKSCIDEVVVLLKLLSHPIRLKISCDLILDEKCVSDPCKASLISQSAFSQHFTLLKKKQIVSSRKKGLNVFYTIKALEAKSVIKALHQHFCR